ncbi:YpmS family protein [Lacticaseibacillus jixiensis]|uniref:YpmS family protein n=1 Tax=Lacticaseibacillus jixiensis TaxID=3231926 RepID=UPI0036F28ABA
MTRKQQQAAKTPRRTINWWKWVTLVLCGLIIGSGVWFVAKVVTPYQDPTTSTAVQQADDQPAFSVQLTKNQVNRIVDYYLNDYLKDSKIKYSLTVGDSAVLGGSFKFFGATIKFALQFDPLVRSNGDVELKATKLNIGSLPVPISYVLSYVGHSYKLPKWVSLNSTKETVVLKLSEFKLANGMQVRAQKFDLAGNEIDFGVYLPK